MSLPAAPRTRDELTETLNSDPARDRIVDLFAMCRFARQAFYTKHFTCNPEWDEAIFLTDHGTAALNQAKAQLKRDRATAKRVLFLLFYHCDLLVDAEKTEPSRVQRLLSDEITDGDMFFPDRTGRKLYDKFFDLYQGERLYELDPESSEQFLANEPQGVYQIGRYVSGPNGLIESADVRLVPPTRSIPLWHCADPGCSALHDVELVAHANSPRTKAELLRDLLIKRHGPPQEWSVAIERVGIKTRRVGAFFDLIAFFGDCLLDSEVSSLLERLLKSNCQATLRRHLANSDVRSKLGPSELAAALSKASAIQLIFSLSDEQIIRQLDSALASREIIIPPGEIRRAWQTPPKLYYLDTRTEASMNGVRSTRGDPGVNLQLLLFESYEHLGILDKLAWKLRGTRESDPRAAIDRHVATRDPAQVIRELLLSEFDVAKSIERRFVGFTLSDDDESDANRLAWKLGFSIPAYDDRHTRLEERLAAFLATVNRIQNVEIETDREVIRSSGVNLFVSTEEFLEELIAFNIWFLESDHFRNTNFTYCAKDAVELVGSVISSGDSAGDLDYVWSNEGKNTLGCLLVYLDLTVKWMKGLAEAPRMPLRVTDMPHFADRDDRIFPYRHRTLWANAAAKELSAYAKTFDSVAMAVKRSKLSAIRNGLDHKRSKDDFPSISDMKEFCCQLQTALQLSDQNRLFPKVYWKARFEKGEFGQTAHIFRDFKGGTITLRGPSVLAVNPRIWWNRPHVIAPGNLLGYPNGEIVLTFRETSEYAQIWSNYPRRKPEEMASDRDTQPEAGALAKRPL